MKFKKIGISLILAASMASSVLCTACMNDDSINSEKLWEAESAVMDSIGYEFLDSDAHTASPQRDLLYQNEDKTVVYRVEYHADITAEKAAAEFENGKENITKEKSTWEDTIWKYNIICRKYQNSDYTDLYVSRRNWDIELWKYVKIDEQQKTVAETLFFDKADGCYSVEMVYPENDIVARNTLYDILVDQKFQVDIDRIEKISDSIEWDYEVNDDSGLVITVTNNSDETLDVISCMINAHLPDEKRLSGEIMDFGYSLDKKDVKPDETFTFNLSVAELKLSANIADGQEEIIKDFDYSIDINFFDKSRKIDENGEVLNSF